MEQNHSGNAMTEIALALAMGFFSIMVLTIVSMGSAGVSTAAAAQRQVVAMQLAESTVQEVEPATRLQSQQGDYLLIYYRGHFLDRQMEPVSVNTHPAEARVVLALEPQLPLRQVLAVRARVAAEELLVSELDLRWLEALAESGLASNQGE